MVVSAPHSLSRLLGGIACVALALLIGAPAASATVRYASTTGATSGSQCTSPDPLDPTNPPCSLQRAVEQVPFAGDEVIVAPGIYNEASEVTVGTNNIVVHGVAGQPRPEIDAAVGYGIHVTATGSTVRYLRLRGDDGGIRFSAAGTGDQIIARQDTISRHACAVLDATGDVTLSNSVCRGDTDVQSLSFITSTNVGAQTLTLRNVSVVAPPAASGVGIFVEAGGGSNLTLDAKNVIADGDVTDVSANQLGVGSTAAANLAFSNYATRQESGGATVTDPATNQMTPPVFADADLHQAASSMTINAGTAVGLVGAADVDGDSRTLGAAPDIGADEFVPAVVLPPPAPSLPPAAAPAAAVNPACAALRAKLKKAKTKKQKRKIRRQLRKLGC